MKVKFKTDNGQSFDCEMPVIPRKGECILISEMGEIYTENDSGFADWEVKDVTYEIENGVYLGVTVFIDNF